MCIRDRLGGVDHLHYSLLNDFQRGFPLEARPYASIGECLGEAESEVINELAYLRACGKISRVGAVFAPCTVCLLYTSDAADERSSVDLGGRRIIKNKTRTNSTRRGITKKKKHKGEHAYTWR